MKKVLCNVLYKPFLTIQYRQQNEKVDYGLGLFADKQVAKTAVEISRNIIDKMRQIKGIEYIGFDHIDEMLVPESRMDYPFYKRTLIHSIEDFCMRDAIVNDYAKRHGQSALQEIISYAKEHIAQTYTEDEDILSK